MADDPDQRARMVAVLRDVIRNGGSMTCERLHVRGHLASTIWVCADRGWLSRVGGSQYDITDAGREEARTCLVAPTPSHPLASIPTTDLRAELARREREDAMT